MDQPIAAPTSSPVPLPHPPPPPADTGPGPLAWQVMVAILALLLGLAAAWAIQERKGREQLAGRVEAEIRHATFVQAKTDDLLRLLARQDTQIIRLGSNGPVRPHVATIIWNPSHGGGFVYTDLPGTQHLVASIDPSGDRVDLVSFEGDHAPASFHLPAGIVATDVRFAIVDKSDNSTVLFAAPAFPGTF